MNSETSLHLARHADTAWRAAIRPWFERGRGRLQRAYVIVPTRGQAHGLKQRCLIEGVPLLGVEFLTPGLARKKWAVLEPVSTPAMGRELLLLQLRTLIARRLQSPPRAHPRGGENAEATAGDPAWGFWKSLASDAERALDDCDELLQAGLGIDDFPLPELRAVFRELADWVRGCGYSLAALQSVQAAARPAGARAIAGRVLVYGFGPETAGEFFNVAAFVRRCAEVTAVLPEPEFEGAAEAGERWIELWSRLLGADPLPLDLDEPERSCEPVAAVWAQHATAPVPARLIVGRTRGDEMRRVADEICALLDGGAGQIAVVFPRADPAHLTLARRLREREVAYADLLETAGAPPIEVQAQRALLAFFERGGRVEELLALWPWLRALGTVKLTMAAVRRACDRSFDTTQTHEIGPHRGEWEVRAPELARIAGALGGRWPEELPLADALDRFRGAARRLELEPPDGWGMLDTLAAIDREPKPITVLTAALASSLPESSPVADAVGGSGFARVTLTTRRRAEGLAWSHVILVESNAGVWPRRPEPSCWLTDEQRAALNRSRAVSPGLFTADDRAALERSGYAALARDTREQLIFSAALADERDPEVRLAPNSWVERIMWANGQTGPDGDLEAAFTAAAEAAAPPPGAGSGYEAWHDIWRGRRDPRRPFDEFFFAGDPARITPDRLPAKLIERGVQDPAELWFEGVLKTGRVPWEPLVRARRKALGQWAHQILAAVLTPGGTSGGFGEMPAAEAARPNLADALAARRAEWPANRYWDSFHAELAHICRALLDNVYAIDAGRFVATEAWLPAGAQLEIGGRTIRIAGRLDLVRLDQPAWRGAHVDIVDFKTGGDPELSAARMARSGASLQLGIYLAAARSLGISGGRVWMMKPEPGAIAQLEFSDLGVALARLQWLEQALARGVYGALTRDRSEYAPAGCDWPLACTPIPQAVLERKFEATFGLAPEIAVDE